MADQTRTDTVLYLWLPQSVQHLLPPLIDGRSLVGLKMKDHCD